MFLWILGLYWPNQRKGCGRQIRSLKKYLLRGAFGFAYFLKCLPLPVVFPPFDLGKL